MGSIILGKKTIPEALVYFVSQMIGGILGYGILKVGIRKAHYSFAELITINYAQIMRYIYYDSHNCHKRYDLIKS